MTPFKRGYMLPIISSSHSNNKGKIDPKNKIIIDNKNRIAEKLEMEPGELILLITSVFSNVDDYDNQQTIQRFLLEAKMRYAGVLEEHRRKVKIKNEEKEQRILNIIKAQEENKRKELEMIISIRDWYVEDAQRCLDPYFKMFLHIAENHKDDGILLKNFTKEEKKIINSLRKINLVMKQGLCYPTVKLFNKSDKKYIYSEFHTYKWRFYRFLPKDVFDSTPVVNNSALNKFFGIYLENRCEMLPNNDGEWVEN